jgi:Cellulase (glycosyl hydrolase family 5)
VRVAGFLFGTAVRLTSARRVGRSLVVAAACVLAVVTAAGSASARTARGHLITTRATIPLRTAFFDRVFESPEQATAFTMAQAAGASYVRLEVPWRSIAPATPDPAFVAADPTSPGYNWVGIDATVEDAAASGLTPILDIVATPAWAYDKRPSGVNAGSPKISELGDFAAALAAHYDGTALGVPAEHVFQVWNEANNSLDLNPASGNTYRAMVNAVADSVHAVDPTNLVVAGSLDPFGHPKSKKQTWYSVAPLAFMRSLLCLSKGKHPHRTCRDPVRFDVWSHHPYTFGGPFGRAKLPDDVELGDLPKMRALLQAGVRLGQVVSANPVQFWVTEFGWDTNPPRPHAAPLALAARWTAESLHQMWLSGVSLVTWFLLEDYPSPSPYQSGLYFHSASLATARAKPGLTAFRFPFVAYLHKKTVSVWGRDATSDKELVTIQRRHGKSGSWRTVAQVSSNASGIFLATLKLKATKKDWLRAVVPGSDMSLAFSLSRPKDPNIGPWGN